MTEKARCQHCWEFKEFEEFQYFEYLQICRECLPPATIGYIAGFFDGEGHVEFSRYAKHPNSLRFSQATPEPLHFIMDRFSRGLIYFTPNKTRGIYNLIYNGRFAVPIGRAMLPYLIVKQGELEVYLHHYRDSS